MIVFAPHDLLKDTPFTRLHLVTCRNRLIYLQPPAQKKVLSLFHFGLKAGSVLFLGPSESPGELSDEFESIY
jgi:two-component system CheB/CheR fusion protein